MNKNVTTTTGLEGKTKENLKQRAYLNSLTSVLDFVVTQATGFIVSPFIVNGLGSSMYGTWQMLMQMTGYAKVADTRATQVLKWTVAKKKDIVSDTELRSDVSSAFVVTLFIVPLVLVAGGVLAWYAPYITKASEAYFTLIRVTCSMLILSLVVSRIFDLYESVLRGMNLAFKRMGLRAAIVAFGGGLKILVITQGLGLIGLSVVQVVIAFVIGLSYYIVVRRAVGWFGFGKTNFAKVKKFSKTSSWYLADTGASLLLENSDKILLGFILGPTVVTYYTLTLFLPMAMLGMINRIVLGVVPGIGKLLGLEEYDKVHKVLSSVRSFTFLLTTAAGATIILFNSSFLNAWVGNGYYAGHTANFLITMFVVQETFIRHDAYVINATLDLRHKVLLSLVAGIMFILAGVWLIEELHLVGICIALIIGKSLLFLGQKRILQSKIPEGQKQAFSKRLHPILVSVGMLGLAAYMSAIAPLFDLWAMVGLAPVIFVVSFLLFYYLGLQKADRIQIKSMVSSIKFFKAG